MEDDFLSCNNFQELAKTIIENKYKNKSINIKSYNLEENFCLCEFNFSYKKILVKIFLEKLNITSEEVEIEEIREFSIFLVKQAYDFIKHSFNKTEQYSNECMDEEKGYEIISLIERKITFFNYLEEKSFISFINDIFVDILTKHKLRNGNKRMAFAIMLLLLDSCGFYFKYTKVKNEDSILINKNIENINFIKELLTEYEQNSNENRLVTLKSKTYKFIKKNIIVNLDYID